MLQYFLFIIPSLPRLTQSFSVVISSVAKTVTCKITGTELNWLEENLSLEDETGAKNSIVFSPLFIVIRN
jgi:hypothetical protein